MKLFQTNQKLISESVNPLPVKTPLGSCICEFQLKEEWVPSCNMEKTESNVFLTTWKEKHFRMECLQFSFKPALPKDLRVDEAVAYIWRFLPACETDVSWKCYLKNLANGNCETGENLISCLIEEKDVSLSIGTEDEEMLSHRAENGLWIPMRLKDKITEENIQCLNNGLEIRFAKLLANESLQIQFIVAWSSIGNKSLATWTVVEQPYNDLLQYAGFL